MTIQLTYNLMVKNVFPLMIISLFAIQLAYYLAVKNFFPPVVVVVSFSAIQLTYYLTVKNVFPLVLVVISLFAIRGFLESDAEMLCFRIEVSWFGSSIMVLSLIKP